MGGSRSGGGGYWERGEEKIKFPKKLRSGLRKGKGQKATWDGTGIGVNQHPPVHQRGWMVHVFGPPFTPIPSFSGIRKVRTFYQILAWNAPTHYEMLKLSIYCTRFETNYSSCTSKRSENICSSSGGAQENGKIGWNSVYHQNWWFSEFHHPLNANVLFCRFFKNLTLYMTKLRVRLLCLSYFTDNSNMR